MTIQGRTSVGRGSRFVDTIRTSSWIMNRLMSVDKIPQEVTTITQTISKTILSMMDSQGPHSYSNTCKDHHWLPKVKWACNSSKDHLLQDIRPQLRENQRLQPAKRKVMTNWPTSTGMLEEDPSENESCQSYLRPIVDASQLNRYFILF